MAAALSFCTLAAASQRACADLTPLSEWSLDGDNYLLYKTFNNLFGLTGSNAVTSNAQLVNNYGMTNPGTLQAEETRMFAVSAKFADISGFSIFGNTTSDVLRFTNIGNFGLTNLDPTNTSSLRNFTERVLFNDTNYTGTLNFSINNGNPYNGGEFYSDIAAFSNTARNGNDALERDVNHFIYFNVTSLMQQYFNLNFDYTSAYLVGYEDRSYYSRSGGIHADWDGDYQDGVFLIFSNHSTGPIDPPDPPDPPEPGDVPEPATLLLWTLVGLGLAGSSWTRKHRGKKPTVA